MLTRSEVLSLLAMDEVIEAVEQAHVDLGTGKGADLGPVSMRVPSSSAVLLPMTASLPPGSGVVKS